MEENNKEIFIDNTENKNVVTLKETLVKFLAYWPLFVLSLAISIGAAFLYLRGATTKYKASALLLVRQDSKSANTATYSDDPINDVLTGKRRGNLDNELQMIRNIDLMKRVVIKNQFNISYYIVGRFKNTDMYTGVPFRLILQNITDSSTGLSIKLKNITNTGVTMEYGPKDKVKTINLSWNTPYLINGKQFVLAPRGKIVPGNGKYMATWSPIDQSAGEILSKFSAKVFDKGTTILRLEMVIENRKRGVDILNAICKEYDMLDLEEKNTASRNALRFIDDRIDIVGTELSGVETSLESYQGKNQIVNVESQSSQSFANSNEVSKDILDIDIQQGVVSQIQNYFNNPSNQGKLVPSSLGINDPTLGALVSKYNELELQKQREKPLLSNSSAVLKDLDNQINDVKGSVLENLQNITKNLSLQQKSLQQKNSQYKQFLVSLPRKERVMQEIKRKQSISEGLYLYLLQKREETSISAGSSTVSIYKQLGTASAGGQVEPNTRYIKIFALLFGLLIPVGLIKLGDQLNDKILTRHDVTSKVAIPVLGELTHIPKRKARGIMVMKRDLIGEQFRLIRTNLSLLEKPLEKQVILVTSSVTTEGKSFTSLNLAAVLAIPGKKVALLEFDMRKPGITKALGFADNTGLSDYLAGQVNDVSEIYKTSDAIPTLHIYPSGPIPNNPADLLVNDKMGPLFDLLKRQYDYVVIDTAPVGLVTDAFILNKYCTNSIYIIRQRFTLRKQLDFVNDIFLNDRLHNLKLILNDVKTGGKYGYGYGYTQNYNYNYDDNIKRTWWKKMIPFRA